MQSWALDFEVGSQKHKKLILGIPGNNNERQEICFRCPQVTVEKQATLFFYTPSTCMVLKTGQYPKITTRYVKKKIGLGVSTNVPETHCYHGGYYKRWSSKLSMQQQRVVIGFQNSKWRESILAWEFLRFQLSNKRLRLSVHTFKLKKISVEAGKQKEKAEAMQISEYNGRSETIMAKCQKRAKNRDGSAHTRLWGYRKVCKTP